MSLSGSSYARLGPDVSNRWDERYASGEMAAKPAEPLLAEAAALVPAGEALDVACGIGRHTLWLARRGWRVTAVDASAVALATLAAEAAGLPVDIVQADLEADGYTIEPERFQLIVDTCFLHRPLFPAMRAGVAPGGVFFGVFPLTGDDSAGRPMNPAFLVEQGELPRYFEGWRIVHYSEGRPGEGRRLRAQIVAQREEGR
jgi:tellurite methyltransferase